NLNLARTGAVSGSELDKSAAARGVDIANVAADKSLVASRQLDLEYTKVIAPVSGRVSRYVVTVGNLIQSGDQGGGTLLTTIVSVDPMYAYFDVDERTVLRVRQLIREGKAKSARESEWPMSLGLATEEGFPHQGTINFVDNQVNPKTGTLRVRGVFPNKDEALSPGFLARVRVPIGQADQEPLIPPPAPLPLSPSWGRGVGVRGKRKTIMLARFFIDRPVLAWVISVVIVLLGAIAAGFLPVAEYPEIQPPTVRVTASYPGANAQVVADTVAAPVEQQVVGVEGMLYMSSQSNNDGSYTLDVTFELGTNVNMAQVLVQNRVAIAEPTLPDVVRAIGVTTTKRSPDLLLGVSLYSEDNPETGRPYYDSLYLSNYATIQLKDAVARVEGVGDVVILGQQDYSMRVWLDPDKLQSRNVTVGDVIRVLREQNVQVAAGQIGQPPVPTGQDFQYTMSTLGRLV